MPDVAGIALEFPTSVRSSSGTWYQVLQRLGAGKNASAFLVMATSGRFAGVPFALKLFTRVSDEPSARAFRREAEFLKSCDHPAIMRVLDDGMFQRKYAFMVVEYLPLTLRHAMNQGLTIVEKVSFVLQLLSALRDLGNRTPPLAHCDIKPENIFVKGRSCVLGDFGLIRGCDGSLLGRTEASPLMPRSHRTPDLVAYWNGTKPLTAASDVFQLGLVAAELFTSENPLVLIDEDESKLAPVVVKSLGQIAGSDGDQIARIIHEMLQPDPIRRLSAASLIDRWRTPFANIAKLAHALEGRVF